MLFVPGHRPDRFGKAARSGADFVIVDLADAVAADDKEQAPGKAPPTGPAPAPDPSYASTHPAPRASRRTAADHGCPMMVPKAEGPAALTDIAVRTAGRCPLIPLIETALGVVRAYDLCSVPGVVRAAFGNVDLVAELGTAHDDTLALAHARSRLVLASAAVGICPPVDGVTTAVRDQNELRWARAAPGTRMARAVRETGTGR
ncbi:aldolase/citrate lyase family protein [Streptomyces sp. NPDC005962]|uniref:aldolase/citrate lyase family protein n=1 Tax=Streptomyces sp. NPDC005962 TaxID=3154466 RepID=UPI0033D8B790